MWRYFMLWPVALFFLATAGTAYSADLAVSCTKDTDDGAKGIVCDVRTGDGSSIKRAEAYDEGGKKIAGKDEYSKFGDERGSVVWMLLIQRTAHPSFSAKQALRLVSDGERRLYGVYTFTDKLEKHSLLGSSAGRASDVLTEIADAKKRELRHTGGATRINTALQQAIEELKGFNKARRKAIVVFGDGRTDPSDVRDEDVIALAQQNGIPVFTVLFDTNNSKSWRLEDLAQKTGGTFESTTGTGREERVVSEKYVRDFSSIMEKGGFLKIKNTSLSGAENQKLSFKGFLSESSGVLEVQDVPIDASLIEPIAWWLQPWILVKRQPIVSGAVGALIVGLLILTWWLLRRRRSAAVAAAGAPGGLAYADAPTTFGGGAPAGGAFDPTVMMAQDTVIVAPAIEQPPNQIYAWIQFLDAASTKVPIGATNVNIGRHPDNDVHLENQSVHRQHAVIHMKDNAFVINDLGTKNGVIVNGQRVDKKQLANGDLVELGEVRFRFMSGNGA